MKIFLMQMLSFNNYDYEKDFIRNGIVGWFTDCQSW